MKLPRIRESYDWNSDAMGDVIKGFNCGHIVHTHRIQ